MKKGVLVGIIAVFSMHIQCVVNYSPDTNQYTETYANNTMIAYQRDTTFVAFIQVGEQKIVLNQAEKFYHDLALRYRNQTKQ